MHSVGSKGFLSSTRMWASCRRGLGGEVYPTSQTNFMGVVNPSNRIGRIVLYGGFFIANYFYSHGKSKYPGGEDFLALGIQKAQLVPVN